MVSAPFRIEGFSLGFTPAIPFLAEHRAGGTYNLHLHAIGVGSALVEPVSGETKLHMYGADHSAALGRRTGSNIRRWDVVTDRYLFTLPPGLALLALGNKDVPCELVVPTTPVSQFLILSPPTGGNRLSLPDGTSFAYSKARMNVVDVGETLTAEKLEELIAGLAKGDRQLLHRTEQSGGIGVAQFSARDHRGPAVRESWYFIPLSGALVTFMCQASPQDYVDASALADKVAASFREPSTS